MAVESHEGKHALSVRLSANQVGHGFGLKKIHLTGQEGASGELAWIGGAGAGTQKSVCDGLGDSTPAMKMEFGGVLTGIAGRCGHPEHHPMIEGGGRFVSEPAQTRVARLREASCQKA